MRPINGSTELVQGTSSLKNYEPSSSDQLDFFNAATEENTESLLAVLAKGINVNSTNSDGRTALMISASQGNLGSVQELINSGADVTLQGVNDGVTALKLVAGREVVMGASNDVEIVAKLLEQDSSEAHVNAVNEYGETALMLALQESRYDVLLKLKEVNADANLEDNSGHSALTRAVYANRLDLVLFLAEKKFPVSEPQQDKALDATRPDQDDIQLELVYGTTFTLPSPVPAQRGMVQEFEHPTTAILDRGKDFILQDRSLSPALAIGSQSNSSPSGVQVSEQSGQGKKRVLTRLSEEEKAGYEDPPSPGLHMQSSLRRPADQKHPDNELVKLPGSERPDSPGEHTA